MAAGKTRSSAREIANVSTYGSRRSRRRRPNAA
jgi:hypothetical protein